jgi:hypothetical protein
LHFIRNIVSFEQAGSVDHFDTINIAAENRAVATEHSSMSQDNITAKMANLLAVQRSYRENLYRATDEQVANTSRADTVYN